MGTRTRFVAGDVERIVPFENRGVFDSKNTFSEEEPRMPLTLQQLRALDVLVQTGLDQPSAQRRAWFDELAVDDPSLRELLARALFPEQLIETSSFLDRSPAIDDLERTPSADLKAGQTVGTYTLIAPLGEGGSASVWRAQRSDGALKREIALKLPYFVGNTRGWYERVTRERDILASLNHPNIASIYDAGIEANGRPWLALELIDGTHINAYCKQHALNVDQRIALVVRVARAVEYAHARGVIHRDLKPGNVLVDGNGQVKLLDFGIAKLFDANDSASTGDATMLTRMHGRPFTPEYASPEQKRGEAITTGVDVYALGTVLYELIVGVRPERTDDDAPRIDLRAALKQKQPDAANGTTRNDLSAIIQKALHTDPGKRYVTVNAFADDLERYRNNEAVVAQPDSALYRATQFFRRHRVLVGGASAVFLSLGLGLAATLWQAREADQQRDIALLETARAESAAKLALTESQRSKSSAERAEQLREQADFSRSALATSNESLTRESDRANLGEMSALRALKRNEVVKTYLLSLFATAANQREGKQAHQVEDIIARAGKQIADVVENVGNNKPRTSALPRDVENAIQSDAMTREEIVSTVAKLHQEYGLDRASLRLWALLLREKKARSAPASEIADVESRIGLIHSFLDMPTDAEQWFSTSQRRIVEHRDEAQSYPYGTLLARRGRARLQALRYQDALADSRDAISRLSSIAPFSEEMMLAKHVRAAARGFAGESKQQIQKEYRDLIDSMQAAGGAFHPNTILYQVWLTSWLIHWREHGEAKSVAESAWVAALESQGDSTQLSTLVAYQLGQLHTADGDYAKGRVLLERTASIQDKSPDQYPERDYFATRSNLIEAYSLVGLTDQACEMARKTVTRIGDPTSDVIVRKQLYAIFAVASLALLDCGDYGQAVRLLTRAVAALERGTPGAEGVLYQTRARLAAALALAGESTRSDELLKQVFQRYESPNLNEAYPRLQAEFVATQREIETGAPGAVSRARNLLMSVEKLAPKQKGVANHLRSTALRVLSQALLASNENIAAEATALALVELVSSYHAASSLKLAHDRALAAHALARNGKLDAAKIFMSDAARVLNDSERSIAQHLRMPLLALQMEFPALDRDKNSAVR
jgi:serine/threonine protein kinase